MYACFYTCSFTVYLYSLKKVYKKSKKIYVYPPAVSVNRDITRVFDCGTLQERAGVKMILIQDASQGPNVDKPLRIIGEPYKVQVHTGNQENDFY